MAYEEKGNAFGIHKKKCFKVSKGQKLADFRYFFRYLLFSGIFFYHFYEKFMSNYSICPCGPGVLF